MGAVITSCGKALPKLEVQNDELKALVDTNDEWIRTRTGIGSRHISIDESTQDLAYLASCAALGVETDARDADNVISWNNGKIDPASLDLIIFPTITSDTIVPSAAALLKRELGAENAVAFDINAACTGFIYGVCIAESMMAASNLTTNKGTRNRIKRALVVCSERLSRLTDWTERGTCILFGDGAGAAVLEWDEDKEGIISTYMENEDDLTNSLTCPQDFSSAQPFSAEGIDIDIDANVHSNGTIDQILDVSEEELGEHPRQVIRMDGQTVFKFAGKAMANAVQKVVEDAGLKLSDIALVVPHQANERIIKFASKRLSMDMDFFQLSIIDTGNTSSSGVPMALCDAYAQGKIKPGDYIVLVAFGGGLTSGAILYRA